MSTFSSNIGPEEEDGAGWGGLLPTKAEREEERRFERERQAKNYATTLAINIHAKHYAEVTQWKPLPDTLGVLTQIDNMTSGLVKRNRAPLSIQELLRMYDECGGDWCRVARAVEAAHGVGAT